jgi:hypothetical protein
MPICQDNYQGALLAGWSDETARRAGVAFSSGEALRAVAALPIPDAVRALVLRDADNRGDDRLVAAFNRAAEVCQLLALAAKNHPDTLSEEARNPLTYIAAAADGTLRLMPMAAVRSAILRHLAEHDEHIDTSRPAPRVDDEEVAREVYEKRAAHSGEKPGAARRKGGAK